MIKYHYFFKIKSSSDFEKFIVYHLVKLCINYIFLLFEDDKLHRRRKMKKLKSI